MRLNDGDLDNVFFFGGALNVDGDTQTKLSHDRYDVYVNGEFVGHKNLLNQSDDITDVNDFLHTQGLQKFQSHLDGNHYELQAEGEQAGEIMEALKIYFQNR